MNNVIVIAIVVVVNTEQLTTITYPIVNYVTTEIFMWSLIQLTTGLLTTMGDHIFVVVIDY